ncbi:MAG: hypothetical protein U0795_14705 [Pirellulales bacterium]
MTAGRYSLTISLLLTVTTLSQPGQAAPVPEAAASEAQRMAEYTVDTVLGTGQPDANGDAGAGREMNIGDPFGVEIDPDGNLVVTEVRNHRIWQLDLDTGQARVIVGTGRQGHSGDGGTPRQADLNEPYEVRFDGQGNLFWVEMQNHIVRKLDRATQVVETIAGTGQPGYGGDGGPARQAQLNQPHSIALDGTGGLLIADIGNHRIRRVDLKSGTITSIAGSAQRQLPQPGQIAADHPVLGPRALYVTPAGIWVALREGHSVWRLAGEPLRWEPVAGSGRGGYADSLTGGAAGMLAGEFNGPKGLCLDPTGRIVVVDTENHAIRQIDVTAQTLTTIAGGGPNLGGFSGDGGPAPAGRFNRPHGVCCAPDGTIYIGDTLNHRVRVLRPRSAPPAAR